MRSCPICNEKLKEIDLYTEIIDRCCICDGAFFDKGELEAIVRTVEVFTGIQLDEKDIDTISELEKNRIVKCPACKVSMNKQDLAGVFIDICPDCQGIWLDKGEIIALKIAEDHIKENLNLYIRLGE